MNTFKEYYGKNPRIPAQSEDFFRLIPQEGVRHTFVEHEPTHNAIWDMNIRKSDGRVFFSVCGEGLVPDYARLYEYIPGDARIVHHFSLENESIQQDCALRPSKFHTSIQFMDDGRIIMQSHTSSPSPLHPVWMPAGYLNHQWEGFKGSEIFIYNPETKLVQCKGVFSPYNTMYGGALSRRTGLFFAVGYLDGAGYVYDLNTNKACCIGQVTDGDANRFYEGPDGHIYYGTQTGLLSRFNVDTRKVEFLLQTREKAPLRHGTFDDNDVLWFTTRAGKWLYTYNLKTGEYKEMGRFHEDDEMAPGQCYCYGLGFDSSGCLWYCSNYNLKHVFEEYTAGSRLFKWDIRRGKKPVDFGFIGTADKRSISLCAQALIHDDKLFITDGNHLTDSVGILEIDLSTMTEDRLESRPLSTDVINYLPIEESRRYFPLGEQEYDRRAAKISDTLEIFYKIQNIKMENLSIAEFKGKTGVALWEHVGYGNGSVKALRWEDNETLTGICGGDDLYEFRLKLDTNGLHLVEQQKCGGATIPSRVTASIPDNMKLPCMPGRQYLAEVECSVRLGDGSIVAGTKDMMLCHIRDGRVFGLGAVATSGGVHCLSVAPDGKTVYGVAGYELGRGEVFRYSEMNGLSWLGMVPNTPTPTGRQIVTFRPWVCSVSPDGKYLAIGALDEMSGVGVFTL